MLNGQKVISIIPARANSKGLPGKNYKHIMGKPLVDWSIESSGLSEFIDVTVVSTNCEQVKTRAICSPLYTSCNYSITKDDGIKFKLYHIDRPEELCTDESLTEPAMIHALDYMEEEHGMTFGYVVLLQPTSPFRPNCLIDKCLNEMIELGHDSCMTVSSHTPFFWHRQNGVAVPGYDPNNRPRRQDIPDEDIMYHDNGNIYAVEVDKLRSMGRIGSNPLIRETTPFESMQIDTEDDFKILEAIARRNGGFH